MSRLLGNVISVVERIHNGHRYRVTLLIYQIALVTLILVFLGRPSRISSLLSVRLHRRREMCRYRVLYSHDTKSVAIPDLY